jgi:hypothetical protein
MSLIEQYNQFNEHENPCPIMSEATVFTIHTDSSTPFTWLLNEYLQRTEDKRRYLTIMFEDAVRYGKITTVEEARSIAQSMKIMKIDDEDKYANPNDPNWSEEKYVIDQLACFQPTMTDEEREAFTDLYAGYEAYYSQLN